MAKGCLLAAITLYLVYVVEGTYTILSCKKIVRLATRTYCSCSYACNAHWDNAIGVKVTIGKEWTKPVPEYKSSASLNCREVKFINFREIWIPPLSNQYSVLCGLHVTDITQNKLTSLFEALPLSGNYFHGLYRAVRTDLLT